MRQSSLPFCGEISSRPGSERTSESQVTYGYIVVAAECNYIVCADTRNAPRINRTFLRRGTGPQARLTVLARTFRRSFLRRVFKQDETFVIPHPSLVCRLRSHRLNEINPRSFVHLSSLARYFPICVCNPHRILIFLITRYPEF